MKSTALAVAGIAAAMYVIPAVAHHSFAMFDASKTVTLQGVVKEFHWTNPHSWIFLTVTDAAGQSTQWAIELGSPALLVRRGWGPKVIAPGMNVKVAIHPLRDGNNGGQFLAVTLPDGTLLGIPPTAEPGDGNRVD